MPVVTPHRFYKVPDWDWPMLGNVSSAFDMTSRYERALVQEIAHGHLVQTGIGAEGPAMIEEFVDPDEISAGDWNKQQRMKREPRQRKSLEKARLLMTAEEREDEGVRAYMRELFAEHS